MKDIEKVTILAIMRTGQMKVDHVIFRTACGFDFCPVGSKEGIREIIYKRNEIIVRHASNHKKIRSVSLVKKKVESPKSEALSELGDAPGPELLSDTGE